MVSELEARRELEQKIKKEQGIAQLEIKKKRGHISWMLLRESKFDYEKRPASAQDVFDSIYRKVMVTEIPRLGDKLLGEYLKGDDPTSTELVEQMSRLFTLAILEQCGMAKEGLEKLEEYDKKRMMEI